MGNIEYIVLNLMKTPGRWSLTLVYESGEKYNSGVMDGNWENYLAHNWPGYEVKVFDSNTQHWSDYTQKA